ncbi:MAG: L-threonylcarbamoyladenylate synthase [Planctomycetota bacterium]
MQRAVFLDRDGTLIEDRGHIGHESDVALYTETVPSLRRLQERFRLFIVTNQPGIAEGTITREGVERVNRYLTDHLAKHGVDIADVYVCPHQRSDGCSCIKPNSHFLHCAAEDYGIDLSRSYVLGDHPSDVYLADNAGATGVYVLTGHGSKHRRELSGNIIVEPGISRAADRILDGGASARTSPRQTCSVDRAGDVLREGGVAVFPTETVYGIGAGVFKPDGIARIFEIKKRPLMDPLIAHVACEDDVNLLADEVPEEARLLARRFWPGPLTMVLPKCERVPDLCTAALPSVAIRMPDHPVALGIIRRAETPIAAPSANFFGATSPSRLEHVDGEIRNEVDAVVDGGPCRVGVESTIVSFCQEQVTLLRPGGVAVEEIERVIGEIALESKTATKPTAPGMLDSHYAPDTPLVMDRASNVHTEGLTAGLITFEDVPPAGKFASVEVLSPSGDFREATRNLYAALHRLDAMGLDVIVAEPCPAQGLGNAIMDRLERASTEVGYKLTDPA